MRLLTTLRALRKSRPVSEADQVTFVNRELVPLLAEIRDFIAQLVEGSNDSDILLMDLDSDTPNVGWSTPRARVLHLTASQLTDETIDFSLAVRIHLALDVDITTLTVLPPTLNALSGDVLGQSAHCTLRVKQPVAGGKNIAAWSSNVKFPNGTVPSLTAMTNGQRRIFAFYVDGTDGTFECVHSGPFG